MTDSSDCYKIRCVRVCVCARACELWLTRLLANSVVWKAVLYVSNGYSPVHTMNTYRQYYGVFWNMLSGLVIGLKVLLLPCNQTFPLIFPVTHCSYSLCESHCMWTLCLHSFLTLCFFNGYFWFLLARALSEVLYLLSSWSLITLQCCGSIYFIAPTPTRLLYFKCSEEERCSCWLCAKPILCQI